MIYGRPAVEVATLARQSSRRRDAKKLRKRRRPRAGTTAPDPNSLWPLDGYLAGSQAFLGLKGWALRPRDPFTWIGWSRETKIYDDDVFVTEEPLMFSGEEVLQCPDACMRRLLLRLYEAFGIAEESDLPSFLKQEIGPS
jgi:hypothetical protein